MTMTPGHRKFVLTVHITTSVGWLGAVASSLALAVAGLTSLNAETVRAAYIAMEVTARFVIVPLCIASLLTGLVLSLGTKWGLFRHYWILVKFVISVLATIGLFVHLQPISYLAGVAAETTMTSNELRMQIQLVVAAGSALLVLLVVTLLAVYKPRGLTRYGWRKQYEQRKESQL